MGGAKASPSPLSEDSGMQSRVTILPCTGTNVLDCRFRRLRGCTPTVANINTFLARRLITSTTHGASRLHSMVPGLGADFAVRFQARGYSDTVHVTDGAGAFLGNTKEQKDSEEMDGGTRAVVGLRICPGWLPRPAEDDTISRR